MNLHHLSRQVARSLPTEDKSAVLLESLGPAAAPQTAVDRELPRPDPAMTARDEAIFLLQAVAEVEHALMAQYLFAGYSLNPDAAGIPVDRVEDVRRWRSLVLGIAKEEMGHLITVQNLLLLIGGPLHFGREDYPFDVAPIYPFTFELERLTRQSLAKYILAEMPEESELSPEQQTLVDQVRAALGGGIIAAPHVNRVGQLYNTLIRLFSPHGAPEEAPNHLRDSDFVAGAVDFQALGVDWETNSAAAPTGERAVYNTMVPPVTNRDEAVAALLKIAEQGEGMQAGGDETLAHFDRFLHQIFVEYPNPSEFVPTHQFPADTRSDSIPNADSRRWAQLFNLRYRLLLSFLHHSFLLPGATANLEGGRTPRGYLVTWTFFEMRHIKKLSEFLPQLPHDNNGGSAVCAPPFEMPYTLEMPTDANQRWLAHREVVLESEMLIAQIEAAAGGNLSQQAQDLLTILGRANAEQKAIIDSMTGGPVEPPNEGYQRVVEIFEEAVRGFEIEVIHRKFWREDRVTAGRVLTETEFVDLLVDEDWIVKGDADASHIITMLRRPFRTMPLARPPIPDSELEVIKDWINSLTPDGGPGPEPQPGPTDPQVHLDYWRDFDDQALFQATPQTNQSVGAFFAQVQRWRQFALDPSREAEWNTAVNRTEVVAAVAHLSGIHVQTVQQHYGDPIDQAKLFDGYQHFGANTLPDDPARPQDVRHNMNGESLWFRWCAFWEIELRAILIGLLNDGLMRGRFTVNGFSQDATGQAAIITFVTGLANNQLQAETRQRYRDSGLAFI